MFRFQHTSNIPFTPIVINPFDMPYCRYSYLAASLPHLLMMSACRVPAVSASCNYSQAWLRIMPPLDTCTWQAPWVIYVPALCEGGAELPTGESSAGMSIVFWTEGIMSLENGYTLWSGSLIYMWVGHGEARGQAGSKMRKQLIIYLARNSFYRYEAPSAVSRWGTTAPLLMAATQNFLRTSKGDYWTRTVEQ